MATTLYLHPIEHYANMDWQALIAEWNTINAMQRSLTDYDRRKALLGLYLANLQDFADIQAYQQKIAARCARIATLIGGAS